MNTERSALAMGMWPLVERSRIAKRRLPSPTYEPSGKRCSHRPESSGPRCACTWVMRASTSRLPQFTRPLIVDLGFGVEHLDGLERTVNQAGNAVEKA